MQLCMGPGGAVNVSNKPTARFPVNKNCGTFSNISEWVVCSISPDLEVAWKRLPSVILKRLDPVGTGSRCPEWTS